MSTLPGFPDPLEETADAGDGSCPLGCDDGWIYVGEKYAEHQANLKMPPPEGRERDEAEQRAWQSLYAAHKNSTYPCRIHRQIEFHRWAGRHYEKDHDVRTCEECITALGGKAKARKFAALAAGEDPRAERVRRDLE